MKKSVGKLALCIRSIVPLFLHPICSLLCPEGQRRIRLHKCHTCSDGRPGRPVWSYISYYGPFKVKFLAGGKVNEKNEINKVNCGFFIIDDAWIGIRIHSLRV